MARWVSNPLGANAPPESKLTDEWDLPGPAKAHMTHLNSALKDNSDVLIHCDAEEDYGIVGQGNWQGYYVGIAYCPFCGSELPTDGRVVGKVMAEFAGHFSDFDDRGLGLDGFSVGDYDLSNYADEAGLNIEGMSLIEALIRLQGYRDEIGGRYLGSKGRAELDFDKEWPPKELAAIAQFCAEHGPTKPDLALSRLLERAEQPAVWALALLDLAASEIPGLHNIYFEQRPDGDAGIVIETKGLKTMREIIAIGAQVRSLGKLMRRIPDDQPDVDPYESELKVQTDLYRKLQNIAGYLTSESDVEEGILRYRVQSYYREDVLRFLQGRP
jgi:hypothetical protein